MKKENVVLGLSSIAIVISIIAICLTAPRSNLGFDYQGVLVGTLTLLVTTLIGWNIYSLIDIRKLREEITLTKGTSIFNAEKNNLITCHAVGDFYYYVLIKSEPLGVEYQFLYYRISELYHSSNIGEYKMCESIIKTLLEMFVKPEDVKMIQSCKDRLIGLLAEVKGKENIVGYNTLMSTIARIGIKPNDSNKQK